MDLTIASELCPCSGVLSWSKYTRTPSINTFFLHAPSPPHCFGSKSTAAQARLGAQCSVRAISSRWTVSGGIVG